VFSFALAIAMLMVAGSAANDAAQKATVCGVRANPLAFNHKLIEISGTVSHGLEDFTLSDPGCNRSYRLWLEYGGLTSAGTVYCCGATGNRRRRKPLTLEGITVPLVDDATFTRFDTAVQTKAQGTLRATVVARFFAGELKHWPGGRSWGGFGHLGCCSELVIQQVLRVGD
jgi:hypothetical protein